MFNYLGWNPVLTNSISFDAKAHELRRLRIEHIDIMAIGSSMTLNNLKTSTIDKFIPDDARYYNLASWGLTLADLEWLIDLFIDVYDPKVIIMASSPLDFQPSKQKLTSALNLSTYINGFWEGYYFIRNLELLRLFDRQQLYERYKAAGNNSYHLLSFDKGGGVNFDIAPQNIDSTRWNRPFDPPQAEQYKNLERICDKLKKQDIIFVFAQVPLKRDYYSGYKEQLNEHFNLSKSIVEGSGHLYLNLHNENIYKNTFFCDQIHLNGNGAVQFTRALMEQLPMEQLLEN